MKYGAPRAPERLLPASAEHLRRHPRRAWFAGLGAAALVCAVMILLGPSVWPRRAVAQGVPEPSAVVDGFEQARNRRDVEATLAFFADDATLTDRTSRIYRGKDEIRGYFQQLAARGRGLTLASVNLRVNGPQVTWTERPPNQNAGGFEINVDAVVREGKIRSLTYTSSASVGQRIDPALDTRGSLPPLVGVLAVLLTLGGAISLVSTAGGRPAPGRQSQLRGRLVAELATWRADQHRSIG